MSSKDLRTDVINFITDNIPSEIAIDITAEYRTLEDMIADAGLTYEDDWLGIQYIGSEEIPINVGANNTSGCFRETGVILLHIVAMTQSSVYTNIIDRSDTIRDTFRGVRINDIVIEAVSPPNFESGATLDFEEGYTSATVTLTYYMDINL